jgi:hypothetical protein
VTYEGIGSGREIENGGRGGGGRRRRLSGRDGLAGNECESKSITGAEVKGMIRMSELGGGKD